MAVTIVPIATGLLIRHEDGGATCGMVPVVSALPHHLSRNGWISFALSALVDFAGER